MTGMDEYTERIGSLDNPCMLSMSMHVSRSADQPGMWAWRLVERADASCYTYDTCHGKGTAPSLIAAQHQARSLGIRLVVEKWRRKREWASDYALKRALGDTCRCGHSENDHRSWSHECKVQGGPLQPPCSCKAFRVGIAQTVEVPV